MSGNHFEAMSKQALTELLERLQSKQQKEADAKERILHELRVHQVELEMQNRELREVQERLEESRDRYADLYDFAPLGYFTFDRNGLILAVNLTGAILLGRDRSRMIGLPFINFLTRRDRPAFLKHLHNCLHENLQTSAEFSLSLPTGKTVEVELTSTPSGHAGEQLEFCRTAMTDISERKSAEQKLRLAAKVLENTQEGVLVTDAQKHILAVNPAFTKVTGYSAEDVIGKSPDILQSGIQDAAFYQQMWKSLKQTGHWQGEIWNRRKSHDIYPEWLNISLIKNAAGEIEHYVGIFSDISSQENMKKHLHEMAYYDSLTGLPNRNLLMERLRHELLQAKRSGSMMAILFLDIDRFKVINDTLGHSMGDLLLKEVASRLGKCIREGDTLARLGGDEFVALLQDVNNEQVAIQAAGRMLEGLSLPLTLQEHELFITTSIGICLYPMDGEDIDTLIRNADAAMYRAKESGRNNYQFYAAAMNEVAQQQFRLESGLRRAIERNELFALYQPQIDLESGRLVGAEALLRWRHPELGLVSPKDFIPIAEDCGLIDQLGNWVLRTACKQNKAWQDAGLPPIRVAVNISSRQFKQKDLFLVVSEALEESGLAPQYLELELTESIFMEEIHTAISTLKRIKQLGVALSIDDFGTGFSSLSRLRRFPIDTIKIDQSFVQELMGDTDSEAVVKAIIALAHNLKLNTIAEGVETEGQRTFLQDNGCQLMQGYLYARPLEPSQFSALLI
ncbi:MAG: EAL domain-containing protein [Nitrosomonadales bacterium]|nr:EAL domain-containing protein [Nitrosomonadales bacterium]